MQKNQLPKYLITGGAGFIGSHLVDALLKAGNSVTIIDDLSTGQYSNIKPFIGKEGFRFAIESIMNETVLDRLASESDVIIHLAAAVGVQLVVERPVHTIETNVEGTERVLKFALRYRSRVLVASTSEIYGKGFKVPFSEDDDVLLGPSSKSRWGYAISKLADECLALAYHREYGLPATVFRLFNTVGPRQSGQYGMVIPRFMDQALKHEPLTVFGDGNQRRCFCHVSDVVRAIISLAQDQNANGLIFNIGSTEEIAIKELAELTLSLTGSTSPITYIPYSEAYAPGFEDMDRRIPDISRIASFCKWRPQLTLRETLISILEYRRRELGLPEPRLV